MCSDDSEDLPKSHCRYMTTNRVWIRLKGSNLVKVTVETKKSTAECCGSRVALELWSLCSCRCRCCGTCESDLSRGGRSDRYGDIVLVEWSVVPVESSDAEDD